MPLPFVSRGRFEDAQAQIRDLRAQRDDLLSRLEEALRLNVPRGTNSESDESSLPLRRRATLSGVRTSCASALHKEFELGKLKQAKA
jgi:hypothetical protein